MKYLSITLVLLTLIFMMLSIEQEKVTYSVSNGFDVAAIAFQQPKFPNVNLLAIEKQWIKIQKDADAAKSLANNKQNAKDQKLDKSRLLAINGLNYTLLGIFFNEGAPFIVLKTEDKQILKINEGAPIVENVFLTSIELDKIVLTQENETIVYKIFERSKNDDK